MLAVRMNEESQQLVASNALERFGQWLDVPVLFLYESTGDVTLDTSSLKP